MKKKSTHRPRIENPSYRQLQNKVRHLKLVVVCAHRLLEKNLLTLENDWNGANAVSAYKVLARAMRLPDNSRTMPVLNGNGLGRARVAR